MRCGLVLALDDDAVGAGREVDRGVLLVDELGGRADEHEALVADAELAGVALGDGVGVAGRLALGEDQAAVARLALGVGRDGRHGDQQDVALADLERPFVGARIRAIRAQRCPRSRSRMTSPTSPIDPGIGTVSAWGTGRLPRRQRAGALGRSG